MPAGHSSAPMTTLRLTSGGTVLTKDAPTSLWKWSKAAVKSGCQSIAYTYSEPTTFYEYMIDTAQIARASGLYNIWVSNG